MKTAVLLLVVFAVVSTCTVAYSKEAPREPLQFESPPHPYAPLPPDLVARYGWLQQSATVADTFVLHYANFGTGGNPDPMGYTPVDFTAQTAMFFHVADAVELDGGDFGNLNPLSGLRSMWCGVDASTDNGKLVFLGSFSPNAATVNPGRFKSCHHQNTLSPHTKRGDNEQQTKHHQDQRS